MSFQPYNGGLAGLIVTFYLKIKPGYDEAYIRGRERQRQIQTARGRPELSHNKCTSPPCRLEIDRVPTYQTKNRGRVLIINNVKFKWHKYRYGAQVDEKKLKTLFEQMGFEMTVARDLKKSEMEQKVKAFSEEFSLRWADITVVIVMSHGTRNKHFGFTEICGSDDETISVEDLMLHFSNTNCRNMANKPKIFIFQCCRGEKEQRVLHTDSVPFEVSGLTEALTDTLVVYSSLPGFVSHRDLDEGTWYFNAFCEVLSQHAHEHHVEDLLKMVDAKIQKRDENVKQTTHYENRGFKRCYLKQV